MRETESYSMQVNMCIHFIEHNIYDTGSVRAYSVCACACVRNQPQKQSRSSDSIKPFNTSLGPVSANAWSV